MIGFSINPDPTPQEKEENEKRFMETIDQAIKNNCLSLRESTKRHLSILRHELPCRSCDGKGIVGQIRYYYHDKPLRVLCEDCGGTGIDGMGKEV